MKTVDQILIVDDDATARFLMERTIKKSGLCDHILTANNGQEALNLLNTISETDTYPSLILLDINMPLMNGFEFLGALQASDLAALPLRIALLTSSSNPQDVIKAQKYLLAGYLQKPLTTEKLQSLLTAWKFKNFLFRCVINYLIAGKTN